MTDSNDENNVDNETTEPQNEEQVDHMAAMAAAMEEAGQGDNDDDSEASRTVEAEVTPRMSAEQIARTVSGKDVNIEALLKVPVSLSIEVGRTKMALNDLLDTQEGSVI